MAGNAITSSRIEVSEVKAADIAADAVGGSEIKGVTILLFSQCTIPSGLANVERAEGAIFNVQCTLNGVDSDDTAIVILKPATTICSSGYAAYTDTNQVIVYVVNECPTSINLGQATIGIVVFDT